MTKSKITAAVSAGALISAMPGVSYAADNAASVVNTGDTAFIMVSTVLVLLMTPGLAFFYAGMVRKKNVLNTLMNVFMCMGVVSLQWIFFGYSLSFGGDVGGLIGNLDFAAIAGFKFSGVNALAPTIPHGMFMFYQMMFAIITPALVAGSVAERMRFSAFILFTFAWTTLVYDPLAHWVWGDGGWLRNMGVMDFAGGTVVHISSGVAGLVAALMLGKRRGYGQKPMIPHNIPYIVLGTSLLWFGWIGFNGGSALAMNEVAVNAMISTHTSGAAGLVVWMIIERIHRGKVTAFGAASGAVVGLATITQASGFVTPVSAAIIGSIGVCICYFAVAVVKHKFGYDDSLDTFGCHGIGGIWGGIAVGIFADKSVNPGGGNGLLHGDVHQFLVQLLAVFVTIAFSVVMTFGILKLVNLILPLRVKAGDEEEGLDLAEHGEDAYSDTYDNDMLSFESSL